VPAPAQHVVIGKTLFDQGFPLCIGHCIPQFLVSISQASEFHWSLLYGGGLSKRRTFIFERFATRQSALTVPTLLVGRMSAVRIDKPSKDSRAFLFHVAT
jgi:hypothetical protein